MSHPSSVHPHVPFIIFIFLILHNPLLSYACNVTGLTEPAQQEIKICCIKSYSVTVLCHPWSAFGGTEKLKCVSFKRKAFSVLLAGKYVCGGVARTKPFFVQR